MSLSCDHADLVLRTGQRDQQVTSDLSRTLSLKFEAPHGILDTRPGDLWPFQGAIVFRWDFDLVKIFNVVSRLA